MAQTFESRAWESVARGEICGAGAECAAMLGDVVRDTGEVEYRSWCSCCWRGEIPVEDGVFGATGDEDRVHGVPC